MKGLQYKKKQKYRPFPRVGSNWDTVTGLLKVTAIFRNCIVTGIHFQNKECIGTWGYLIAGKVTLLMLSD